MSSKKRKTPFQKGHEVTYGLRVTEVDPRTKMTRSVVCRFCEMFGREERPGSTFVCTRSLVGVQAHPGHDYFGVAASS